MRAHGTCAKGVSAMGVLGLGKRLFIPALIAGGVGGAAYQLLLDGPRAILPQAPKLPHEQSKTIAEHHIFR
jgi:hypothetical protein